MLMRMTLPKPKKARGACVHNLSAFQLDGSCKADTNTHTAADAVSFQERCAGFCQAQGCVCVGHVVCVASARCMRVRK